MTKLYIFRNLYKIEYLLLSIIKYYSIAKCPHCGESKYDVVGRKFFFIRILKCVNCLLYYMHPIYKTVISKNFYDRLYAAEDITTEVPTKEELQRLMVSNFEGSPKDYSARLKVLRGLFAKKCPLLLEVGSSWGYFLFQANKYSFKADGVEISSYRREVGKKDLGVNIYSDLTEVQGKYDLIYSCHSLEHFTDISDVFEVFSSLLVLDEGLLCIEVPNIDYENIGKKVFNMMGAVHPLGYCADFFRNNLASYGLELIGVYEDWGSVFKKNVLFSTKGEIIIVAKKIS